MEPARTGTREAGGARILPDPSPPPALLTFFRNRQFLPPSAVPLGRRRPPPLASALPRARAAPTCASCAPSCGPARYAQPSRLGAQYTSASAHWLTAQWSLLRWLIGLVDAGGGRHTALATPKKCLHRAVRVFFL